MKINRSMARIVSKHTESEWMPFREAARRFLVLSNLWNQTNKWRLEVATALNDSAP